MPAWACRVAQFNFHSQIRATLTLAGLISNIPTAISGIVSLNLCQRFRQEYATIFPINWLRKIFPIYQSVGSNDSFHLWKN